ncbi:glycosyl transferase [Caulobacter segnis]|uniref:Glycosyl transferase group 1 n=2 Tax=Caulobacter segnis TaxID=88688 RepID=D5VHN8_CAUST|nr:glycosyltransferase [Caulobacter segnis]ADG09019.1 glycosyl transferase group 1 [Caulobacter segnis ATCC 21756]AVQ00849.1 glycosyl transferase [Caulobacter segnis]
MRLLHVIPSSSPAYGGPIEGLIRQNETTLGMVERELVTLDRPEDPWVGGCPMTVHPMGKRRPTKGWPAHYGYTPDLIPWLRENLTRYDAAVVHGLWNYASFAASRVLPHSSLPYFVFSHGMLDPWFKARYPLKHLAKQAFWTVADGPLLSGAQAVFFTTEEEKLLAHNQFFGHRYRPKVVGYGTARTPIATPLQKQAFEALTPGLAGQRYLLFLSRIHPKKGCDLLIRAFAETAHLDPTLHLVIAGPDEIGIVNDLKAQAAAAGIADRIHWPGLLKGDAKWGAFHHCEAFVLPSHQENFGIAVAEALACGRPVLITDKVNIWREVSNANAGLVETDDQAGTTRLLQRWAELTPEEKNVMASSSSRLFFEKFDVSRTGPALIELIREQVVALQVV